jgi:hypothetical protein
LFANLPYKCKDAGSAATYDYYGPQAAGITNSVNYFCYSAELDGAIFAMSSIFDTTVGVADWIPSVIKPVMTSRTAGSVVVDSNRFSYHGSNYGYINSANGNAFAQATNRPETYVANKLGNDSHQKPGTCVKINVTGYNITTTAVQFAKWLMSIDLIKPAPIKGKTDGGYKGKGGK